mgnify:CR=1 FL=1|tara:strand:+ start:1078 stop:1608 length:531 start_codon:yes stop_codon:yes gene_type:complete
MSITKLTIVDEDKTTWTIMSTLSRAFNKAVFENKNCLVIQDIEENGHFHNHLYSFAGFSKTTRILEEGNNDAIEVNSVFNARFTFDEEYTEEEFDSYMEFIKRLTLVTAPKGYLTKEKILQQLNRYDEVIVLTRENIIFEYNDVKVGSLTYISNIEKDYPTFRDDFQPNQLFITRD